MKQLIDHKRAAELTRRFMDGATSTAEERELYAYYGGGDVAPELEPYRAMLLWMGGGMRDAAGLAEVKRKGRWLRLNVRQWVSVAASVALVVTLGVAFLGSGGSIDREKRLTYAGSYVIRNGERITDLEEIMPELERADRMVQEQQRLVEREVDFAEGVADHVLAEAIDMSDPDVRAAVTSALSD